MVVGLCQLTFHLPGNRSLKGKRQVVRRICERVRNRFHISIAEVGHLDQHQSSLIGLAVIGNETRFVQSVLDQIVNAIEQLQLAPLLERKTELLHYNEFFDNTDGAGESDEPGWDYMREWDDEFD